MIQQYELEFYAAPAETAKQTVICDSMAEAVEAALSLHAEGKHPVIRCEAFQCAPMCANKWSDRPVLQFWFSFPSADGFKSVACRHAEDAGVRYRSHRAGYRASLRAVRRFAADWDAFAAERSASCCGDDRAEEQPAAPAVAPPCQANDYIPLPPDQRKHGVARLHAQRDARAADRSASLAWAA